MSAAVLLIKTPDRKGLVSKITTFVFERGFNILNCQEHVDLESNDYFMRLKLDLESRQAPVRELDEEFGTIADQLGLAWSIHYSDATQRVAIMVSKASHCLYDLLVRARERELACEIPLIIANHATLASVAEQFGIPFLHLPVTPDTKLDQEKKVRAALDEHDIDLVVLARYMQILSPPFVDAYSGRIINIHHAFLPAFQGANPYQRAHERGVKMIGATAHYVTEDLDEGPIIEQDVERVTHEDSPRALQRIGRDIERIVLARAVKAHLEHRVIVAGRRVIVFSSGA
jgi:formyltetrahydrofolate deformylase